MSMTSYTRSDKLRVLAALSAAMVSSVAHAAYPAWKPDTFYAAGTFVSYNGADYRALVDQVDYASTGWNPTNTSLWAQASGGSSGSPGNDSSSRNTSKNRGIELPKARTGSLSPQR